MKRIAMAVALWSVCVLPASAAIPATVAIQGVLAGPPPVSAPKPDGSYSANFRLYAAPTGGTALWSETKTVQVSGGKGVFVTALGSATAFPPSLTFDQPYYLSVQMSGDPEMAPRIPLLTAPYAQRAASLSLPYAATGPGSGTALSISNPGATALGGTTTSGVAVRGDATSGIAVRGESDTGTGVLGLSGAVHDGALRIGS